MPAEVIFDTNILFSATGWRGNPFKCLELARSGKIRAATCIEILTEFAEKLSTKLSFSDRQIDETLADYLRFHRFVEIRGLLNVVERDPEDNAILECAIVANSNYVVTGDDDLLVLREYQGIQI